MEKGKILILESNRATLTVIRSLSENGYNAIVSYTKPLWTESPEVQKHGLKVLLFRWRIYCKTKNGIVSASVISSLIVNKFLKSS